MPDQPECKIKTPVSVTFDGNAWVATDPTGRVVVVGEEPAVRQIAAALNSAASLAEEVERLRGENDRLTLQVDAYLAHASAELEGALPIDGQVLMDVGLYKVSADWEHSDIPGVFTHRKSGAVEWWHDGTHLATLTTRAAVRSLLAVLGKGDQ